MKTTILFPSGTFFIYGASKLYSILSFVVHTVLYEYIGKMFEISFFNVSVMAGLGITLLAFVFFRQLGNGQKCGAGAARYRIYFFARNGAEITSFFSPKPETLKTLRITLV
jgi:hypothetical protein